MQAETLQELMETGEGLAGARWGERMVMGVLPRGHSQFMSRALTWTWKGGSVVGGLGAVGAGEGHPEGCKALWGEAIALGRPTGRAGKNRSAFEL